ncbi:DUF1024 family protein [Staphylococcus caprae]|uniref:DUF1024 family protein n=1 Tax=Staphylococcus caprae TaxID=29380 RepID=UPI003B228853
MSKREQIEQVIISAGAFTGEDTEALLSEMERVYEKVSKYDEECDSDGTKSSKTKRIYS